MMSTTGFFAFIVRELNKIVFGGLGNADKDEHSVKPC